MTHMRRVVLLSLAAAGCRGHDIIDHWGPPAGFGAVAGVIRNSSGVPKPNVLVAVSICGDPLGGFLGEGTSDQQGHYRVDGSLPPIGSGILGADTLRIACELFVGPRGTPLVRDTITVRFWRSRSTVQPAQRDISLP
jgi:hypothetical protein